MAETKYTKEYAAKLAEEKFPDESYWIGAGSTSRIYNPNLKQNKAFTEGYMTAIEKTAAPELLEALILAKKWLDERGNNCHWQDKEKINNAIKKATE